MDLKFTYVAFGFLEKSLPLLYPLGSLVFLIIVVVHRFYSRVELMVVLFLESFQILWELVLRAKAPRLTPVWFLKILHPKCVVSLATESYFHLLGGNQGQQAIAYIVWGVSWISLANNSKGCFPCLTLEFLLESLCLLGSIIIPNGAISLIQIYT